MGSGLELPCGWRVYPGDAVGTPELSPDPGTLFPAQRLEQAKGRSRRPSSVTRGSKHSASPRIEDNGTSRPYFQALTPFSSRT